MGFSLNIPKVTAATATSAPPPTPYLDAIKASSPDLYQKITGLSAYSANEAFNGQVQDFQAQLFTPLQQSALSNVPKTIAPGGGIDENGNPYSYAQSVPAGKINGINVNANYDENGKLTGFSSGLDATTWLDGSHYITGQWDASGNPAPAQHATSSGGFFSNLIGGAFNGISDFMNSDIGKLAMAFGAAYGAPILAEAAGISVPSAAAAINVASGVASGQPLDKAVTNAAAGAATGAVIGQTGLGGAVANATDSPLAGQLATNTASGVLRGQDIGTALANAATTTAGSAGAGALNQASTDAQLANFSQGQAEKAYNNSTGPTEQAVIDAMGGQAPAAPAESTSPLSSIQPDQTTAPVAPLSMASDTSTAPSGVQLAAADNGVVSDAGNGAPLSVSVSGAPIYAESKNADSVTPPFGYDLMPAALNAGTPPEGSFYDATQNAWFTPNQEAQDLQQQLLQQQEDQSAQDSIVRQAFGMTVPEYEKYLTMSPDEQIAYRDSLQQGAVDSVSPQDNPPLSQAAPDAGTANQDVTPPLATTTTDKSGLTAPLSTVEPDANTTQAAETPVVQAPAAETPPLAEAKATEPAPVVDTSQEGSFNPVIIPPSIIKAAISGATGGGGSTTPAAASATAAPLSSAATAQPKPLDTSPQYLTSSINGLNPAHLASLHQLFGSLTPELASVLASRSKPAEPAKQELTPEEKAILEANPNMTKDELMQQEYGTKFFAEGGSNVMDSGYSIDAPKFKKYETSMLAAAPSIEQKSRLGALQHLRQGLLTRQPTSMGLAHGGLPAKYAEATPPGHKPEFITGLTGYYAQGKGTGQSDDIDAMLHQGDYVADADLVAALGDGSSKAGAEALEKFRRSVPHQEHASGGHAVPAKIADGEYVFPESFVTAIGKGDNKEGAKILDKMREAIRAHKRSAPNSKIPPKAKSPLDYLKMVKG